MQKMLSHATLPAVGTSKIPIYAEEDWPSIYISINGENLYFNYWQY